MNAPETPLVSVILVNYRGADDTISCLRAFDEVDWPADRLQLSPALPGRQCTLQRRAARAHRSRWCPGGLPRGRGRADLTRPIPAA